VSGATVRTHVPVYVGYVPTHVLDDHRKVEIRPIRADDGARLRAYHDSLSPESQYRRFLGVKPRLSEAEARYLVDVDGESHFALVATTPATAPAPVQIIAVARFIRVPDVPATAEFAIVVGDEYQGQGLAGALMDQLAAAAAQRGIQRFRASMLADNVAIRRLMQSLAAGPVRMLQRGTVIVLEIELAAAMGLPAAA
jgi:RimJ/RimL family protein N-acetyltransferase